MLPIKALVINGTQLFVVCVTSPLLYMPTSTAIFRVGFYFLIAYAILTAIFRILIFVLPYSTSGLPTLLYCTQAVISFEFSRHLFYSHFPIDDLPTAEANIVAVFLPGYFTFCILLSVFPIAIIQSIFHISNQDNHDQ